MKKIEAIIRPGKLEEIKEELNKIQVNGITITQIVGCGKQKGHKEFYRGMVAIINLMQKVKIEVVAMDEQVDTIVNLIVKYAQTGEIGDGKIFIYNTFV